MLYYVKTLGIATRRNNNSLDANEEIPVRAYYLRITYLHYYNLSNNVIKNVLEMVGNLSFCVCQNLFKCSFTRQKYS